MSKGQVRGNLLLLLFGIAALTVLSVAGVMFIGGYATSTNTTINTGNYTMYNQADELINITSTTTQQLQGLSNGSNSFGTNIEILTSGGYNSLRTIGAVVGLYASTISSTGELFGVPDVIANIIIGAVIGGILIVLFLLFLFRVYA